MKLGKHVILLGRKAEVIQIKWNMIKVKFLDTSETQWFPVQQAICEDNS
jgi:hypothetical protein